ncbi:dimethylglycine dehydrogenase, mitochondrial [Aspergillus udagawae]|uniref:Dimethylglycine dehydrogenase, mitochondrial n=1 Tax=Aspergillus udagawae TaxID=91492 RepID=A0A8H3S2Q4_9EURO|nr:dimethylglycine dehydrogenase, mitochondrial [Aspergillus udagawae]
MAAQQTSDIVIIGGGIVGAALAYFLTLSDDGKKVTVIDRAFGQLKGSTAYAPGFVGQFNESEVLTRLAIESVKEYLEIPGGLDLVGGLEVATSNTGLEKLNWRLRTAKERGLEAVLISAQQAAELAPDLVKPDNVAALHFPRDGTANPTVIAAFFQSKARARGAKLLEADVNQIHRADGRVTGVTTSAGCIEAQTVILATGIWAQNLADFGIPVPVIPVAHPYMYGKKHKPKSHKSPFVRYPEHHVYARDHGPFFGLGSYDHKPLAEQPKGAALGKWVEEFDTTLDRALKLIPEETNLVANEKFNGIFSMTPDNMPLVGEIPAAKGLYMAAAVWVTHAAGSAKFLTQLLRGETVDAAVKKALDPTRFQGRDLESMEQESLHCYNSIYSTRESS